MKIRKVLFLTILLLAITLLPCTVNAAVGEIFINDGVEYKILAETGNTGTVQINDYDNNKAQLTIQEIITYDNKQYTVVDIANNAFSGCNTLTNIELPESRVKIGEYAFEDCISLETINIPNNVSEIGGAAFWGCKNLTNDIIIPSSMKKIEGYTFWGCEKLENIKFENGVEYIGVYAFGQNAIQKIILPETITYIDDIAFGYCENLKELIVPNSTAVFYDVITPDLQTNLTIYGFADSTAQEYANTNNHKFVELYSITNKFTNISSNGNLYIIPKSDNYEVILTPNKGYKLPKDISIKIGEYNLPLNDYEYNSKTGDLKITADKIIGDIEIEGFGEKIYKITFDPNKGEFLSGKEVIVYEDAKYFEYDKLEQPIRNGYEFLGYYNEEGNSLDDIMNGEVGIDKDMTFYAEWEKLESVKLFEDSENQKFVIGTEKQLVFIIDNDRGNGKVFVNDKELSEENGDYVWHFLEGTYPSIMLSEDYMKILELGEYTIKFVLDDGRECETIFTIIEQEVENKDDDEKNSEIEENVKDNDTNNSKDDVKDGISNNLPTGDNIGIYVVMFIVSVIGIGAMILIKKKNNK